jgi:hypothetical protein
MTWLRILPLYPYPIPQKYVSNTINGWIPAEKEWLVE